MPLSVYSWIDGITSTFIVFSGILMAIYLFHKWKVNEVRIHFYMGLIMLFAGLMYLGVYLDFVAVLLTGHNINNTHGRVALLSYIWFPPLMTIAIITFADILIPDKKLYFAAIYITLSIFFYIVIFSDPYGSFNFEYPKNSGGELIDYNTNLNSLAGALVLIYQLSVISFIILGFLPKALKAKDLIRKKFFYIIIGMFMITISGVFEALVVTGIAMILIRACYILGFYVYYLGIQPVKEYLSQTPSDESADELEIDDNIVSIAEKLGIDLIKPETLTEEDIAFYKEQTVCLVCKKNLLRFISIYICPEYKSLYCQKCAQALTGLENVCWSCDTPIDEKKPVKRIMREEEKVRIETSEKKTINKK